MQHLWKLLTLQITVFDVNVLHDVGYGSTFESKYMYEIKADFYSTTGAVLRDAN